eukprot:4757215-Heterocapsa_arctica.AAC.1
MWTVTFRAETTNNTLNTNPDKSFVGLGRHQIRDLRLNQESKAKALNIFITGTLKTMTTLCGAKKKDSMYKILLEMATVYTHVLGKAES